jgi:hypothetical protein
MQNLTTLANVQSWVGTPSGSGFNTQDNANLQRLISSTSMIIMRFLSRQSLFKNIITNDTYTGNGKNTLLIQQWPVIQMNQVLVNNVVIPAAQNNTQAGWLLSPWDGFSAGRPQQLSLNGYNFDSCLGAAYPYYGGTPFNSGFSRNEAMSSNNQNVVLSYTTGYVVQNEAWNIPATPYQITALQPNGTWGQDDGVTIAGVAATPVNGTPTTGQYNVAAGVYTFAAADAGKAVVLNYSYIPADIEQACIEMVGEKYSYKSRIGQKSKSLGGQETTTYNLAGITDSVRAILQPYRSYIIKR